jgi:hypothetical protein
LLVIVMLAALLAISEDEIWGMNIIFKFPSVITGRVSLPFDQIMELLATPEVAMGHDTLHFIFFFPIDHIWGRSREVWSMSSGFSVWGQ